MESNVNSLELDDDNVDEMKCIQCSQICFNPHYLHCFHSICLTCLQKTNDDRKDFIRINCPTCEIVTKIESNSTLKLNEILQNRIEKYQMKCGEIRCNSCSSNDRSISHCSTCSSYLCYQCCQAHSMMKCFEHHHVRSILSPPMTNSSSMNKINEDLLHHSPQQDKDKDKEKEKEKEKDDFDEEIRSIERIENLVEKYFQEEKEENRRRIGLMKEEFHRQCQCYVEHLNEVFKRIENEIDEFEMNKDEQINDEMNEFDNGKKLLQRYKHFNEQLHREKQSERSSHHVFFATQIEFLKNSFQNIYLSHQNKDNVSTSTLQIDYLPVESFHQWIDEHLVRRIFSTSKPSIPIDEHQHDEKNKMIEIDNEIEIEEKACSSGEELDLLNGKVFQMKCDEEENCSTSSFQENYSSHSHSQSQSNDIYSDYSQSTTNHLVDEQQQFEPVQENLRALESIFVHQFHHDLQQQDQQHSYQQFQPNHFTFLTRQTSAPPLGQERSPPTSNYLGYAPPSLLGTYSTTNSGGSSNGNNSRSTTPFSSTLNPSSTSIDLLCPSHSTTTTTTTTTTSGTTTTPRRTGQTMQIRTKFGSLGPQKCQFNAPHGFCLGIDEEIIVADTNNHRIQIFDKSGEFKYQFGIPGKEEGQLWYPRKVAVIRQSAKFVVCDRGNERSRMQIFNRNGIFIKKISIRYIDIVAGLAITQQGNIVAVDSVSPTVFSISENGDLLKWFDCSDYMREPSDLAIFNQEYFVCDFKGHCVVVFDEEGSFLRRIGSESITNFPNGIDISDAGDVIIGDSHGNRFHIAVYNRQGDFLQEFDCPYVKVSRCCGLKITSDGFIVTLAKNNHHVLVLNTLYLS